MNLKADSGAAAVSDAAGYRDTALAIAIRRWLSRYAARYRDTPPAYRDTPLAIAIRRWLSRYAAGYRDTSLAYRVRRPRSRHAGGLFHAPRTVFNSSEMSSLCASKRESV